MPSRCSGDPEATEEKAEAGRWAAAADDRQAGKAGAVACVGEARGPGGLGLCSGGQGTVEEGRPAVIF